MVAPPADARLRLRVSAVSGRVAVTAEPRADVAIEHGAHAASAADGAVEIRPGLPSGSVVVRCPEGADVIVGTRSGRVELDGRFGAVSVTSQSGSIRAGEAAEADLRTISGSVNVGACDGRCRISTTSGSITVGTTGDAEISSVSGVVDIAGVAGAVRVRTVSGRVAFGSSGRGPVQVSTVSGTITIRLPAGVRPALRKSGFGKLDSRFAPGDDVVVDVATVSGRVRLLPS